MRGVGSITSSPVSDSLETNGARVVATLDNGYPLVVEGQKNGRPMLNVGVIPWGSLTSGD